MGISQGSVRFGAKAIAQNVPTTGNLGVNLLLTDPADFNLAITQALAEFVQDKPNIRTVDDTLAASGFRQVVKGSGALASLTGQDAFASDSLLTGVWYPFDVTVQGSEPVDPNNYRIVRDPGGKLVLEFLADSPVAGQVLRLEFTRPHVLTEAPNTVTDPAAAPTVALKGAGAGNVTNGLHGYVFTWVTAQGETIPSPVASVTVVDLSANGMVIVTVPVSADYGVTGAKIYRTITGGAGAKLLVGSLPTNGGVFTDNVADGSLGAAAPSASTAGGLNTVEDDHEARLVLLVASVVLQMAANKAVQNTGTTNLPNDVVDRRSQSDIYRSRSKELRDQYLNLAGRGKDADIGPASGFGDLDSESSLGRPWQWHGDQN